MNIQKINPQSVLNSFLDEVLNTNIGEFLGGDLLSTNPGVNIKESDDAFSIEIAAPGLKKTDFNINLDSKHLIVSCHNEVNEKSEEGSSYTRKEYSYSNFERKFPLPKNIDREKISAEYNNGILAIRLLKIEKEEKKNIRIDIG